MSRAYNRVNLIQGALMAMSISINKAQVDRVLTLLEQQGRHYSVEEVVRLCPDLSWDQVFLAIHYLTRTGQVYLTLESNGAYRLQAACPVVGECPLAPSADSRIVN